MKAVGNRSVARRPLRLGRGLLGLFLIVVLGLVAAAAWITLQPRTPEQRAAAATELVAAVQVSATISASSLLATNAIADFGIAGGIRSVHVRIVDGLRLDVRVESLRDIVLAEPPRLCLVGPYSAPDDAGLTDRCWGEPDLAALFSAKVPRDATGHLMLGPGSPIALSVPLQRGTSRCDYPPGTWLLELTMDPLIDGSSSGNREPPAVKLEVPFAGTKPLILVTGSRYCGLAETIYTDQGEPPIATP
jgi:hypothetical protein